MKKAIVIGCPGSGKSTFARALRDKTGLPLFYLDMIWHLPDRTNVTREEFDRRLSAIVAEERWIIDGNYSRTLETRLERCDTVFFLDFPPELCLASVKQRIGREREDMPWIERELDDEFRRWICDFNENHTPRIYELLKQYAAGREIIIFKTRDETEAYLRRLSPR